MPHIKCLKYKLLAGCLIFSCTLFAQIYPNAFNWNGCSYTYMAPEMGSNCFTDYQLMFEDNFDASALDTNTWRTYFPWGRALQNGESVTGYTRAYMRNENVTVGGGYLHLITKTEPGTHDVFDVPTYDPSWMGPHNAIYFKYTSGMIFSKMDYKSGKFEIRAKIPEMDGVWPAFWLFGNCGQEIDAFEFINASATSDPALDGKKMIMSYHKRNYCENPAAGHCDNTFTNDVGMNLSESFHLYSVEWNANKIIWRLDSTVVREVYRVWQVSAPLPYGPLVGSAFPVKDCSSVDQASTYAVFNTFPTEDVKMNIVINTNVAFDRGTYPKEFLVDYIRFYSNSDSANLALTDGDVSSLSIYPNPGKGLFSIDQLNKNEPIMNILVTNALGQTIWSVANLNKNSTSVDLLNQPKGVYFVKVNCATKTYVKRIICN